ncbi:MAG: DUF2029 domain-containing protein [Sphingomonadales bacterium]|nr:DUF2029 domain-containing protein [Sphingomonadales bacterium]
MDRVPASGGQSAAFPYGFLLAAFEPAAWIGSLIGGSYGAHVGLALAILFWEFVLLAAIVGVGGNSRGAAAARVYWLSPVPIYVGYWHGQLDVFPAALLVLGFLALLHNKWEKSGALLGGAVAAKLSMAIALPFVGLYLLGRNRLHPYALRGRYLLFPQSASFCCRSRFLRDFGRWFSAHRRRRRFSPRRCRLRRN